MNNIMIISSKGEEHRLPVSAKASPSSPRIDNAFVMEDCFTETDFPNPLRNIGGLSRFPSPFSNSSEHPVLFLFREGERDGKVYLCMQREKSTLKQEIGHAREKRSGVRR